MPVADERGGGSPDRRRAAVLRDHGQLEPEPAVGAALADAVEETQVLREAAERDVLAVVGRWGRIALALGQRLHRAAERRPRLVERDRVALVGELERGRETGEAASDDSRLHLSNPPATMRSFVPVESDGGPSKTSNPRLSIRSRVAA